jgi:hypothetical protein
VPPPLLNVKNKQKMRNVVQRGHRNREGETGKEKQREKRDKKEKSRERKKKRKYERRKEKRIKK